MLPRSLTLAERAAIFTGLDPAPRSADLQALQRMLQDQDDGTLQAARCEAAEVDAELMALEIGMIADLTRMREEDEKPIHNLGV